MNPTSYFFRVEHDLLRSEASNWLGGSAIKVYLVIGLSSHFGTDWAYPSIRTIASQAGLSRQTVLVAIEQLSRWGLLAAPQSQGAIDRVSDHPSGSPATATLWIPRRQASGKSCENWSNFFRGSLTEWSNFFRGRFCGWSKI